MMMKLKSIFLTTLAALGLMMLSLNTSAATFTGKLNGHTCAHECSSCPVDRLDPHIALEQDFVLVTGESEYYFIPNVRRDVKVRSVLEDAQVIGEKHPRYKSIKVTELQVKKVGAWKTVWSEQLERDSWQTQQTQGNQ